MSDARHRSNGCWTCRIRRKGCDAELPACGDCISLGIECCYGTKPPWMDGGTQQQRRAEQLKKDIKHNALMRRAKARLQSARRAPVSLDEAETTPAREPLTPITTPPSPAQFLSTAGRVDPEQANQDVGPGSRTEDSCAASAGQHDFEPGMLMAYLDYAFPTLFPFYRPSIFEGGRAWLLTSALRYPAFYHNILGLAACFYSAVPRLPELENDACAAKSRTELRTNIDKAVQGVQVGISNVTKEGLSHSLADNVRLLGNIVQLVNFEVVFASSENWQMHLTAAVDLFSQTIEHHGYGRQDVPPMRAMIEQLRGAVPSDCLIWSAEQAALRFFAALVIYQDIIASTAREQASTLNNHYNGILSKTSQAHEPGLLNLEDFVGCQNWILRAIAETSALDQWKKQAKRAGALDIMELVHRATSIQDDLREGTVRLEEAASGPGAFASLSPYQPLEVILARSNITNGLTASQRIDQSVVSRIWAHAAEIYLTTVLSGWQPRNIQLRTHVAYAVDLLSTIDNPSWLRALAWPFCVAGCFATEDEEMAFRNVANASGGLAMFGTMRDALAIMEKVWSMRGQFDADTWDIASCLRILGHSVLLV
jgi:hypothetical protein